MNFLYYLESIRTPFLDYFFKFWTLFGDETLNFALICLLYWCIDKKLAYKIAFTMFISGMIVQNMKISFRVDRPWIRDPNFTTVDGATDTATGYSFPSGHTQGATSVFGTIALSIKKLHYRILCVFVILMVGMSRMYLGVHTLADVTVGLIIAVIIAVICSFMFDKFNNSNKFDIIIAAIFALISLFTLILAFVLLKNDYIKINNVSDCCKLAGAGFGTAAGLYIERKYIKFATKEKNIFLQLIKFTVGILIAVALKSGLKIVLGDNFTVDVIRYFITVMWILAIYPLILNKKKNDLQNSPNSGIINMGGGNMNSTGASGAIPRNDLNRMTEHAKLYYKEIKNRTGDIESVAHNTGFSVEDVQMIKSHIFFNKYDLGDDNPTSFDPDYDMAVSWQRLIEGKNIQEMDIVMMNHELMECKLMTEQGYKYREAHEITEKMYDYSKYVRELNKKEGLL